MLMDRFVLEVSLLRSQYRLASRSSQNPSVDGILRHLVGSNRRSARVGILGLAERTLSDSESELRSVLDLSNMLPIVGVEVRRYRFALAFLGGHDS